VETNIEIRTKTDFKNNKKISDPLAGFCIIIIIIIMTATKTAADSTPQRCCVLESSLISDDVLLCNILHLLGPSDTVRWAESSKFWRDQILRSNFIGRQCWKHFATKRWGSAVTLGDDDDEDGDDDDDEDNDDNNEDNNNDEDDALQAVSPWYKYYRQRCSAWPTTAVQQNGGGGQHRNRRQHRPTQISHLDLIQEQYARDPYSLLTSCLLCSRTSGGYIVREACRSFLTQYPTPTDVIQGDLRSMADLLHPLGLNREVTVKRFASDFVRPWTDVTELYGCGSFARSSYMVFCLGDWKSVLSDRKADRNVKLYASFCRRLVCGNNNNSASDAEEEEEEAGEEDVQQKSNKKKPKPRKKRSSSLFPEKKKEEKKRRRRRTQPLRRSPRQKSARQL